MVYNQLNSIYSEIENLIAFNELAPAPGSTDTPCPAPRTIDIINQQISALANYLERHEEELKKDINSDRLTLIHKIDQRIGAQFGIHRRCALLEFAEIVREKDAQRVAEWIGKNNQIRATDDLRLEFFEDLSNARKILISAGLLTPDVGYAISEMVSREVIKNRNNFDHVKRSNLFTNDEQKIEAWAHWINSNKAALNTLNLSKMELNQIAPYLHYVDCKDLKSTETSIMGLFKYKTNLTENDITTFIKSCTNAFYINTNDERIKELKNLPEKLEKLGCFCNNLTTLDLSKNLQLNDIILGDCPIKTLNLSQNLQLEKCAIAQCSIEALDLSNNKLLQLLFLRSCPIKTLNISNNLLLKKLNISCPIQTIDVSKNRHLQSIELLFCPLETLDVTQNPVLQQLNISGTRIRTLDLSHNHQLGTLLCANCQNLTSLGDSLPVTLLNCENCTNLTQLPQLPSMATVFSNNSPFTSFKVYPAELEQNPLQVLLDLSKILLKGQPMPNIVYIDPATNTPIGIDEGGLRRQFVATLCENLFKKGSGFPFEQELDYATPTLKEGDNPDALRTFARLLGLGIPTGTNLHPAFFQGLFALDDEELAQVTEPLKIKLHMARQGLKPEQYDGESMQQESDILHATAVASKELRELLGTNFRPQNIAEFIVNVQGIKATKETLKEAIVCNNSQYKGWIDNFIDKLPLKSGKATYEVKHLIMLITGSYTLSGEDKIKFEVFPTRKHIESSTVIHTCSRIMELPGDLTEVLLHKELEAQLKLLKVFNAA